MQKIVECIPNFSEGRDEKIVKQLVEIIESVEDVKVLNYEMDVDHNRTVITFAGYLSSVLAAAFKGCKLASQLIDLSMHDGCHPRIGAMDVLPFVPVKGVSFDELIPEVRTLGEKIGDELNLPVYMYGKSALKPEHENLAEVRKGCYEELKEKVKVDAPDFGPQEVGPAGAVAVGVRKFLIAYNINLETADVEVAKKIAKKIRERDGGLPAVKALGLPLKEEGCSQVSMNLVDFDVTSMLDVFEVCEKEATSFGVKIKESELIGLVPKAAIKNVDIEKLKFKNFSEDKVLENKLTSLGLLQ